MLPCMLRTPLTGCLYTCLHCHKQFTRVEGLKKHINSGCSAMRKASQDAGVATEDSSKVLDPRVELPRGRAPQATPADSVLQPTSSLMQDSDFVAQVSRDWKSVVRMPSYVRALREHCVICGQWCEAIKQHVRLMHAEQWASKGEAESRCASLIFPADSPCRFCGKETLQPRRHLTHCGVLFQASLAGLLAQAQNGDSGRSGPGDGSAPGDAGGLGSAAVGEAPDGGSANGGAIRAGTRKKGGTSREGGRRGRTSEEVAQGRQQRQEPLWRFLVE